MVNLIFFSFFSFLIAGADSSFEVTVDKRRVVYGDSVSLKVILKNSNDIDIKLPEFDDFKIVGGPSQSSTTNVQYINGKMTKTSNQTYIWNLIPLKLGELKIPPFEININSKIIKSDLITIQVSKRGVNKNFISPKYFIEAEIDNEVVYRGQQVTLSYLLYTQVDVSSFEDELPKFRGFWTEELFVAKNLKLNEVKKNGKKYYAATIKKMALFPTSSGKIKLDPLTAIIGIREKQHRWNDFSLFGPPSKKYTIYSNEIEINVLPVPDRSNGNISAIVGSWDLVSSVSSIDVKQDNAITYQIKVSGTGNIKSVDFTALQFPNELEVFDPKIQTKDNPFRDKIGGEKIFEWVLIPRYSGEVIIPEFKLDYFDPYRDVWVTKSTNRHNLNVSVNQKAIANPLGLNKEEVTLIGKDIRFIDETHSNWRAKRSGILNKISISLLILSSLIFFISPIHNYRKKRIKKYNRSRQSKNALKNVLLYFDKDISYSDDVYTKIYKAVILYINLKTGNNKVEYSIDEIMGIIVQNTNREPDAFRDILNRSEKNRFSKLPLDNVNTDLINIKLLLKEVDHVWN